MLEEDVNSPHTLNTDREFFPNLSADKTNDRIENSIHVNITKAQNTNKISSQLNSILQISGWQIRKALHNNNEAASLRRLNRKIIKKDVLSMI